MDSGQVHQAQTQPISFRLQTVVFWSYVLMVQVQRKLQPMWERTSHFFAMHIASKSQELSELLELTTSYFTAVQRATYKN